MLAAALLVAGLGLLPLAIAPEILSVRSPLSPADAIVVLGGDSKARVPVAARIFRAGWAPLVLVSGTGDCHKAERMLLRRGVPRDRLALECASRTTRENALFAGEILRQRGLRRVILVTSWEHSGRAAHSFAKLVPGIAVTSYPTRPAPGWLPIASVSQGMFVYEEYAKSAGYCLAYGICP